LLEEAWVSVVPGQDFGSHHPERYLRLAFTRPMEELAEAVQRIGRWLGR
jgi:aspartate/methionine/tyrosine aminotransferase